MKSESHRLDFWVLCGVALGLLLILVRWWSFRAEGEALQREIQITQAEVEEFEPVIEEVKGLKARRQRLESLITGLVRRHRLFHLAAAVLTEPESGVVLESLDVRGFEVEIVARADDEQAGRRWIDALERDGGFSHFGDEAAPGGAPDPLRLVVRGELLMTEEGEP